MDSIHLHKINKGRIQDITTLPVVVFEFSIHRSQALGLGLALRPLSFHIQYSSNYERLFHRSCFFSDHFQLKLNRLTNPYAKNSLSFTLHPTSSSHCTKRPGIYFHVNAKGYYLLTQKDKHPFSAALDPLDTNRIHLSWWIALIRIRSGSPCNWIKCERDQSGFDPDTKAHVNMAIVYKKLTARIASKHGQIYSQSINWFCCRLSFSFLWSSIMCLRGSCSFVIHPVYPQIQEAAIEQVLHISTVTVPITFDSLKFCFRLNFFLNKYNIFLSLLNCLCLRKPVRDRIDTWVTTFILPHGAHVT